jgi:hypothetical protein
MRDGVRRLRHHPNLSLAFLNPPEVDLLFEPPSVPLLRNFALRHTLQTLQLFLLQCGNWASMPGS